MRILSTVKIYSLKRYPATDRLSAVRMYAEPSDRPLYRQIIYQTDCRLASLNGTDPAFQPVTVSQAYQAEKMNFLEVRSCNLFIRRFLVKTICA
jgi:hypothetical protein